MQLTVAEMSQSLLQWDQIGETYLVRSCMQSWIGMPYHGLTAVKNRRVILPVEGSAHRLLRVGGIRAALSFALATRARLAAICAGRRK